MFKTDTEIKETDSFLMTIVRVQGDVDFYSSQILKDRVYLLVEQGKKHIFLDLKQVKFIDSAGLGVLIQLIKLSKQKEGSLSLLHVQKNVLNLIQLTELHKIIPIF